MAVRYHGCTCHQRHSNAMALANKNNQDANGNAKDVSKGKDDSKDKENGAKNKGDTNDGSDDDSEKSEDSRPQPGYFHVVASFILVVHGFTFLVPPDTESEDTDMMRTIGKWFGFDWDWMKYITPYAQGLASVFNIALGIVSWWTSKESERYNRLIQLRVFAFCVNILHAYITGPIIYQNDDAPLLAPGRIIGLFRLSYLTPGLMAAGVTEVILEKEQDQNSDGEGEDDVGKIEKKTDKNNSSSKSDSKSGSKKSK